MRTNTLKSFLIAVVLSASGSALATHEGTWHGGDRQAASSYCAGVGAVFGTRVMSLCVAVIG